MAFGHTQVSHIYRSKKGFAFQQRSEMQRDRDILSPNKLNKTRITIHSVYVDYYNAQDMTKGWKLGRREGKKF